MVVSRVGRRNLTLPERRSLSTSPWDLDRLRRRQRPQEIAEIVCERVKLEANRVGERHDSRVHAAFVVGGNDNFGRPPTPERPIEIRGLSRRKGLDSHCSTGD
jgi:hypothetical protein